MSFFTFQRVAEGYAQYRPHYHPVVMQKIRDYTKLAGKFKDALDVGCGTGLSTVALKEIAERVTGADSSQEMIAVAQVQNNDNITYYHAPAEQLPFDAQSFDIITVCGAINWIDRARFLPEAKRVLKEQGWLIIYDNFITEQMRENADYTRWYEEQYLIRYPKPPRDETPLTATECAKYGLYFAQEEHYTNDIVFSLEEYVNFIMTQSNVIAAVDRGKEPLAEVKAWLDTTLAPILPMSKGAFIFRGYIWYVRQV